MGHVSSKSYVFNLIHECVLQFEREVFDRIDGVLFLGWLNGGAQKQQ